MITQKQVDTAVQIANQAGRDGVKVTVEIICPVTVTGDWKFAVRDITPSSCTTEVW